MRLSSPRHERRPRHASDRDSESVQTGPDSPVHTVRSRAPLEPSREALRDEERARLRVSAWVMLAVACLGLAFTPVLGGDPLARHLYVAGLVWAVVAMAWLLRNSYVATYDLALVGKGAVSLAIANVFTLHYIGPFSQAAMPAALGLYIFCLGTSTRWAVLVYVVLAVPHALLVLADVTGVHLDRGLVRTDLALGQRLVLHLFAQAVYAVAFFAGRAARTKLERVFGDLVQATRLVAQRDVLLGEAKRELERAARVGGEGRYTAQVVGSFLLGNVIGRGGMGEVYAGSHLTSHEEAAVKLLHHSAFADENAVARFAREARVAASLRSPYVVRVLEISDERASLAYLAMERLRGEDLASILRRERRLTSRGLVTLVQQVSRGLDTAREAGVVHRDVKPQNLFLARGDDGSATWKILDFGVSKQLDQATLTGEQIIGTPEYMAPEQAAARPVDHRADLYALCAVLYRCLVSRPPFVDRSFAALVHRLVHEMPVRPGSVAQVPDDVEACLAIGLAKSPDDRFASGAELREAFETAVAGALSPALRARAAAVLARTPWSNG